MTCLKGDNVMDNLKITAIFRGCAQVGENHYVDYAKTRNIPITEEMKRLLDAPKGMTFCELIVELDDNDGET